MFGHLGAAESSCELTYYPLLRWYLKRQQTVAYLHIQKIGSNISIHVDLCFGYLASSIFILLYALSLVSHSLLYDAEKVSWKPLLAVAINKMRAVRVNQNIEL